MDRYSYLNGYQRPPVTHNLVKFFIPGSGLSFMGVASIDARTKLKPLGKPFYGFQQYDNIHCNHVDWQTVKPEIKQHWNGEVIGHVVEHVSNGTFYGQAESPFEATGRQLSERNPGAQ